MSDNVKHESAQTVQVLDLHLDYLRHDVGKLNASVLAVMASLQNMATKEDINRLEIRMSQYPTREEVAREIEARVRDAVPGFTKRLLTWITIIGAACGAIFTTGAAMFAVFKWLDSVPLK